MLDERLKAHPNIKCGDAFDLGIDYTYIHKNSDELWAGTIWILDKVVLPFVINVVSSLLKKRPSKFPQPNKKMYAEVIYYESGKLKKIAIQGEDEDGLEKCSKRSTSLQNKKVDNETRTGSRKTSLHQKDNGNRKDVGKVRPN